MRSAAATQRMRLYTVQASSQVCKLQTLRLSSVVALSILTSPSPARAKCSSGCAARDSVRSSSKTMDPPLVIRSRMRGGTGSAEPKLATADTGNTGAETELLPVIPGATVVGTVAIGAGERTLRRSSMRS